MAERKTPTSPGTWQPSPKRIMAAVSAAQQALETLTPEQREDFKLAIDTIEGESDFFEMLEALALFTRANEKLAEEGKGRLNKFAKRGEWGRDTVRKMCEAAELSEKLIKPLYEVAFENQASQARIIDKDKIPRELMKPDLVEIGKKLRRGEPVPGATLSNPPQKFVMRFH